jgi:GDPmannose 4,6-dehydratase
MGKRALIMGIAGQDGFLLTKLLSEQGYHVFGVTRRRLEDYDKETRGLADEVELIDADLLDESSLVRALERCRPSEVYNLASPSFIPLSWEQPVLTAEFAAVGVTSLLEAIRKTDPCIRFFQASSSEIFGEPRETPQTENTPFAPVTPYGVAKAYGHLIAHVYRRRYELFVCCGILYNHESPRRPLQFLPSKVAHGAAAISLGLETELVLGDLSAARDWGYAADYVRGMWATLQHDEPDDYILATGRLHTVEQLVELAFGSVGLDWREHVRTSESLRRGRAELHDLVGNAEKARRVLGWKPEVSFAELIELLVQAEVRRLSMQPAR